MSDDFSDATLLDKVERLKSLLTAHATGGNGDPLVFITLRREFIAHPAIKLRLPSFLKRCGNLSEFWHFIKEKFSTYAERRAYLKEQFAPLITQLEEGLSVLDGLVSTTLQKEGMEHIRSTSEKLMARRDTDPEGAITSARCLIEEVCKHILDARGFQYASDITLPALYSATAKELNLSPSQHNEQLFKRILGGCQSVVDGLASLRNDLGDAHGKSRAAMRPSGRHALLAVNLAMTMCVFLFQTFEERKTKANGAHNSVALTS